MQVFITQEPGGVDLEEQSRQQRLNARRSFMALVRQPPEEEVTVLEGHPFGGEEAEKQGIGTELVLSSSKQGMGGRLGDDRGPRVQCRALRRRKSETGKGAGGMDRYCVVRKVGNVCPGIPAKRDVGEGVYSAGNDASLRRDSHTRRDKRKTGFG
jgi:hypothetical protein